MAPGLAPGAKRQLHASSSPPFRLPAVGPLRYDVERKPDAGGHRVYAVTTIQGGVSTSGDLVVDTAGFVVSQSLGPPVNLSFDAGNSPSLPRTVHQNDERDRAAPRRSARTVLCLQYR